MGSSSSSLPTQCNVVRAAMAANTCGACDILAGEPLPAGCPANLPAAACAVFPAANARALQFQMMHDPWPVIAGGSAAAARNAAIADLEEQTTTADAAIGTAYPGGGGVTWPIAERCLADDGTPRHLDRADFAPWYKPAPLVGGEFLAGKIWRPSKNGTPPNPRLPMWTDAFLNADLFTVVLLILLVGLAISLAARVPAVRRAAADVRGLFRRGGMTSRPVG
jgi:hypothetical protein